MSIDYNTARNLLVTNNFNLTELINLVGDVSGRVIDARPSDTYYII